MLKLASLAVAAVLATAPVGSAATIPEPVRTDHGLVTGAAGVMPGVRVFKGIPFAAPPVGDRRWRPPQPAAPWDGVRAATKFSDNCMQRSAGGGAFPPYGGDRSATTMSEDCLYLNVYTTAAAVTARQPVMVWIHGGAFTSGAGAIYQAEDLARKGVVVVTVNYRLGAFGFLAHPELSAESPQHVSGNYAFLDQIAGLQWVQKNIAAFGGNPGNVTIFGESAGSWSVNTLVATPLARGLFHRAIGESGGQFTITRTLPAAEKSGAAFAQSLGAGSLSALRALPASAIQESRDFDTSATVDGWVLPQSVHDTFAAGKQNDVPTLIGSNANEGSIFTNERTTGEGFTSFARRRYGAAADAYLKLYPFTTDSEARSAQAASMRDVTFGWEMRTWARLQSATGRSKVFLYYFSHVPPLENSAWLGAQHGAEIPYAFNWPNGTQSSEVAWTATDKSLAAEVSSYWVNFATTGDPNRSGLPAWHPYERATEQVMTFADQPTMAPLPNAAGLDFIDEHPGSPYLSGSSGDASSRRQR